MSRHTPTPWKIGYAVVLRDRKYPPLHIEPVDDDVLLCRSGSGGAKSYSREIITFDGKDDDESNAAFIVTAVNSHEALVEALSDLVHAVCGDPLSNRRRRHSQVQYPWPALDIAEEKARDALKLANPERTD